MNDMLGRLDAAATRQRRFVADASHELRSPLAAIRTTLDVGIAHPDSAPWPVIAERAAQQSVRLEDLIQQLLLLAKADEHQLATQQQAVDIGDLLHDIVASTAARDLDISLTAASGITVAGNPDHLQRLLRNVIDNAVRYAASRLVITATHVGDEVRIEVDDDGPGIPAEDRQRVFDRFVRLDNSRERASGTAGLGLAIAREIALAHRGGIAIFDGDADGTRVVITLPRAAGAVAPAV
jgi:signal transduction histidine kinase